MASLQDFPALGEKFNQNENSSASQQHETVHFSRYKERQRSNRRDMTLELDVTSAPQENNQHEENYKSSAYSNSGSFRNSGDQNKFRERNPAQNDPANQRRRGSAEQKPHIHYSKTNIFLSGLEPSCDNEYLTNLCSKYGQIISSKAIIDKVTNECRGYGFVLFAEASSASQAVEELNSQGILASFAKDSSKEMKYRNTESDSTNLYLANLPLHMDENQLNSMVSPFGNIVSSRILRNPAGISRGVGFVRFDTHEVCEAIIYNFDGVYLPGSLQPLQCRFADNSWQRKLTRSAFGENHAINMQSSNLPPPIGANISTDPAVIGVGPFRDSNIHHPSSLYGMMPSLPSSLTGVPSYPTSSASYMSNSLPIGSSSYLPAYLPNPNQISAPNSSLATNFPCFPGPNDIHSNSSLSGILENASLPPHPHTHHQQHYPHYFPTNDHFVAGNKSNFSSNFMAHDSSFLTSSFHKNSVDAGNDSANNVSSVIA